MNASQLTNDLSWEVNVYRRIGGCKQQVLLRPGIAKQSIFKRRHFIIRRENAVYTLSSIRI